MPDFHRISPICGTLGRYWYALFAVLGLITAFIVAWIVDIACRPVVNPDGLKGALDARSRSKVHGDCFLEVQDHKNVIYVYISYTYVENCRKE